MAPRKPKVETPPAPEVKSEVAAKPPSTPPATSQPAASQITRQKKPKRRQGGKGRPFEPGNNVGKKFVPGDPRINAGGRPKTVKEVRDRINERAFDLVDHLLNIADDVPMVLKPMEDGQPWEFRGPSHHDRILAIRELMHTGLGRPKQTVEMSGPGGGPISTTTNDVSKMTSEAKQKRIEELQAKANLIRAAEAAKGQGDGSPAPDAPGESDDDGESSD